MTGISIKLLRWEPGGFVLFYKRLEEGTFDLPDSQKPDLSQNIDYSEPIMIITGISLKYARKRKRFLQQNSVGNYLFAESHHGAQQAAIAYSLLATYKINNVEPFAWLKNVLNIIPDYPANQLHKLLPGQD